MNGQTTHSRIIINQEQHRAWEKSWTSTTAKDALGVARGVTVTRNGKAFTKQDRETVFAIMKERLSAN